jgi:hypothetical protein
MKSMKSFRADAGASTIRSTTALFTRSLRLTLVPAPGSLDEHQAPVH